MGVVFRCTQKGFVLRGEFGGGAQGGDGGVGHRDRAAVSGVDVTPDAELGGPDEMCVRTGIGPRRGMQPMADRDVHELVVGGVVGDPVDAVTIPIVRTEYRGMRLGPVAEFDDLGCAGERTERADLVDRIVWQAGPKKEVGHGGYVGGIHTDERGDLVGHLMNGHSRTPSVSGSSSARPARRLVAALHISFE